jgi:hypothetical protein
MRCLGRWRPVDSRRPAWSASTRFDAAAIRFYQHHGFVAVPGNPNRLVQKISDIAAALED